MIIEEKLRDNREELRDNAATLLVQLEKIDRLHRFSFFSESSICCLGETLGKI